MKAFIHTFAFNDILTSSFVHVNASMLYSVHKSLSMAYRIGRHQIHQMLFFLRREAAVWTDFAPPQAPAGRKNDKEG
jgi:hypothetical protein